MSPTKADLDAALAQQSNSIKSLQDLIAKQNQAISDALSKSDNGEEDLSAELQAIQDNNNALQAAVNSVNTGAPVQTPAPGDAPVDAAPEGTPAPNVGAAGTPSAPDSGTVAGTVAGVPPPAPGVGTASPPTAPPTTGTGGATPDNTGAQTP